VVLSLSLARTKSTMTWTAMRSTDGKHSDEADDEKDREDDADNDDDVDG
jgi:hypothetical protein